MSKESVMLAKLSFLGMFVAICIVSQQAGLADPPEAAGLVERAKNIEGLIASLDRELAHIRGQLARLPGRKGVTPQEAVEQFKRWPKEPVTVEFGVEPVGYPDAPVRLGDDPEPAISARWDNFLPGGGTLTAIVPPAVYRKLAIPAPDGSQTALATGQERAQVVKHMETHGIRVTGLLEPGGFHGEDYVIRISKPQEVVLYIKGSGK
jgi:hypothetical protein